MKIILNLLSVFALSVSALTATSDTVKAQSIPVPPSNPPAIDIVPPTPPINPTAPSAPINPTSKPAPINPTPGQQKTTQKLCASNSVEDLLPPPVGSSNNSPLSYLQQQGFRQEQDGSWACYVSDAKKEGRYYTLLRAQQNNGKLVASSFLDQGTLKEGQDNRSVDFFMTLIENQTKTNQGNRQSIRRYLESFISLVKQGKVQPSLKGYLFDQPNRGFVLYHPLSSGKLKGTAITINIDTPVSQVPVQPIR